MSLRFDFVMSLVNSQAKKREASEKKSKELIERRAQFKEKTKNLLILPDMPHKRVSKKGKVFSIRFFCIVVYQTTCCPVDLQYSLRLTICRQLTGMVTTFYECYKVYHCSLNFISQEILHYISAPVSFRGLIFLPDEQVHTF